MSGCCGNRTVQNLIRVSETQNQSPFNNNNNNTKILISNKSPFGEPVIDYKPVMTANGKFVKYTRSEKK